MACRQLQPPLAGTGHTRSDLRGIYLYYGQMRHNGILRTVDRWGAKPSTTNDMLGTIHHCSILSFILIWAQLCLSFVCIMKSSVDEYPNNLHRRREDKQKKKVLKELFILFTCVAPRYLHGAWGYQYSLLLLYHIMLQTKQCKSR